ncbi:TlpA disulfide reductase family protein [Alteromonas sp. ASW11-36]|uniref:TlpA disulfide reductase family protein n=1 Tax=Alteromonas arenosi TaxID=3055817 RepID=A0ABT7SZ06_9ALTE|nr:TlpA disulfide reductase family protein [Alteromonas sp. ASW11-36]MDM7860777.1 TlpA disulfide reductase family protein [Alteromonas sp. ASW11-36]
MQKLFIGIVAILALLCGVFFHASQQFDFVTLDGKKYQWQDFGGELTVVNYFAEWCAPCLKEVPELNAFNQWAAQQENVRLFAVSYDDLADEKLREIQQKYNMEFALLLPSQTKLIPIDKPAYLPATYVIMPDGTTSPPLLGEQTADKLIATIEQLQQAL